MKIGVIGLPRSGRTSLLHVLGEGAVYPLKVKGGRYRGCCAMVPLPDDRLQRLSDMYRPRKTTSIKVEFIDIEGAGGGFDRSFFNFVRDCDALLHLIRAFEAEEVPHPSGSVDVMRDMEELNAELQLADLEVIERRREKAIKEASGGREQAKQELPALEKAAELLQNGQPLSGFMSRDNLATLSHYGLLTAKPVFAVCNVDEKRLNTDNGQNACLQGGAIEICVELEKELADIPPEERGEMSRELGITGGSAREKIINMAFDTLGLICFFTGGPPEVKAWPISAGTKARRAAGKIHTDLEKGFIRAEIIKCEDLFEAGSLEEARKSGFVSVEGAEYEIQDGDVMLVRYNV